MIHQIESWLCQVTVKKPRLGRKMFTVFECSPCLLIQRQRFISVIYSNTSGWKKSDFVYPCPRECATAQSATGDHSCILDRKNWPHSKYTAHTISAEEVMDHITLYEGKIFWEIISVLHSFNVDYQVSADRGTKTAQNITGAYLQSISDTGEVCICIGPRGY